MMKVKTARHLVYSQLQIRHMEKAYEGILYKTLDSLNDKLAKAYAEWENESMWIQVCHWGYQKFVSSKKWLKTSHLASREP